MEQKKLKKSTLMKSYLNWSFFLHTVRGREHFFNQINIYFCMISEPEKKTLKRSGTVPLNSKK